MKRMHLAATAAALVALPALAQEAHLVGVATQELLLPGVYFAAKNHCRTERVYHGLPIWMGNQAVWHGPSKADHRRQRQRLRHCYSPKYTLLLLTSSRYRRKGRGGQRRACK